MVHRTNLGFHAPSSTGLGERIEDLGHIAQGHAYWRITDATAAEDEPLAANLPTQLLGPFDEYYLSYADRSPVADLRVQAAVGPARHGMVRAMWLHAGQVSGRWDAGQVFEDPSEAQLHESYLRFRSTER